jgi:hypothetical protein
VPDAWEIQHEMRALKFFVDSDKAQFLLRGLMEKKASQKLLEDEKLSGICFDYI